MNYNKKRQQQVDAKHGRVKAKKAGRVEGRGIRWRRKKKKENEVWKREMPLMRSIRRIRATLST